MAAHKIDLPIPPECPELLRCSGCKQMKPRGEFPRNSARKTTFHSSCQGCNSLFTMTTRLRQEIKTAGVEAFRAHTARQIEIVRLRIKVLKEDRKPKPSRAPVVRRTKKTGPSRKSEILRRFLDGESQSSIARDIGVSAQYVHQIVRGKPR